MKFPLDKNVPLASNQEWEAWGKLDPLNGVATIKERAKNGANPWTEETFYELGSIDWNLFRTKWEQYGLRPGTCVEIGCGAGRISVHMARYFETVHGVDISPGMIEYARQHTPSNVRLHVTNGQEIPLPDRSVDAAFSTHVLQHLSSECTAAAYFKELGRVLRPGGTIMLHVPIIAWPWGRFLGLHKLAHEVKGILDRGHAQLHRAAFRMGLTATPPMQVTWYEISWLYQTLHQCGFGDVEIRILFGGSKMAVQHPFIFARIGTDREAAQGA
jgi:ubiquinone/menaquinone biosynthesis C-methylase UbiE